MNNLTETQQQFINSLPDNQKYYRCHHQAFDVLTQSEYDNMPLGKDKYYFEISKEDYIQTAIEVFNLKPGEMLPCPVASDPKDFLECGRWLHRNSIPVSLVFGLN